MTRSRDVSQVTENGGVAISPYQAGKNAIINGGFDIWQRGTSSFSSGYTADRWVISYGTSVTVSQSTTVPNSSFAYSLSLVGTGYQTIHQRIEAANSTQFVGKPLTVSFWVNTNGTSGVQLLLTTPTAKDNWSANNEVNIYYYAPASGWAYIAQTIPASYITSALANGLGIYIASNTSGTSTLLITGVQVESGSVATPFSRAGGTIQGELAACQRYYYRHATGNNAPVSLGFMYSSSSGDGYVQFPVTMRTTPSIDQVTGTNYYGMVKNSGIANFNSLTLDLPSTTGTTMYNNTQLTGTAGQAGYIYLANSAAYLGFSAEL